jgi:hypothetical protein
MTWDECGGGALIISLIGNHVQNRTLLDIVTAQAPR